LAHSSPASIRWPPQDGHAAQCLAFHVINALPELSIYHLLQPLIAQLPETPEPAIQANSID